MSTGIADHVWLGKQAIIAQSENKLGDQFRPAMRVGWLRYIRNAYPDDVTVVAGPAVGELEGPLVLPIDLVLMFVARNSNPCDGGGDWADFWNEYQPKSHFCVLQ